MAADKVVWFFGNHEGVEEINAPLYVDKHIRSDIIKLKTSLSEIPFHILRSARKRYDGYFIPGVPRGIVKMANLDSIFGLTNGILTFGDLCGGPGGFVEFILHKNKLCTGTGITLNNADKYNIESPRFTAIYGQDGDGDIFKPHTFPTNLELIIADGGLSVRGNENEQESLHTSLCLEQIHRALSALKVGGTFVMKFFDTHEPSSVAMLNALSKCFTKMCIYKPLSSRPANSERYVICKTRNTSDFKLNHLITQRFYIYIFERNNTLAYLQYNGLQQLHKFTQQNMQHKATRPSFIEAWGLQAWAPGALTTNNSTTPPNGPPGAKVKI
jgi:23S rRNA U2552 (ribose-2'-O)-methylase RlmE/FtsJ